MLAKISDKLPSMLADLNQMSASLSYLQSLQLNLNLNSIQNADNMFVILDSLKSYEKDIEAANKA